MKESSCQSPLEWSTLLAYWLDELGADDQAGIEDHYLGCAACSGRLEQLTALARGVRALVGTGAVSAVLDDRFVRRLAEWGLQVREYRVPRNGSVNCTVGPEDHLVVSRLEAPLADVSRLDLVYLGGADGPAMRHEDIPFVAQSGAVVVATPIAELRALPETTVRLRLLAVETNGERTVGEYTFHHTPHRS